MYTNIFVHIDYLLYYINRKQLFKIYNNISHFFVSKYNKCSLCEHEELKKNLIYSKHLVAVCIMQYIKNVYAFLAMHWMIPVGFTWFSPVGNTFLKMANRWLRGI